MTPYRPSGKIDPAGIALLLVSTLAVGAAVGALANVIGQFFRLIILFPLGMGFAVGFVGAVVVGGRRVQAPLVAGVIGMLGGITAWSTDLMIDYGRERTALRAEVLTLIDDYEVETGERIPDERVGLAVNDLLVRWGSGEEVESVQVFATLLDEQIEMETGETYSPTQAVSASEALSGWVRARLDAGTSISRAGRGTGTNVGAAGTAILWVVELLLAGGVGAYMLYARAGEPLCSTCNQWYADPQGILPVADLESKTDVIEAIERSDPSRLAATVPKEGVAKPFVGLRFRSCPGCEDAPVFTEVVRVRAGRKGDEEKVLRAGMIVPGALRDLMAGLEKATAAHAGEGEQS